MAVKHSFDMVFGSVTKSRGGSIGCLQNKKGIKIKYQIKKKIEDLVFEVQFAIRQEELANEEKKC